MNGQTDKNSDGSYNRSGKIKTRVFALMLLMLSCGMIISAARSLGREFSGTMIRKLSTPGITSTQYHLFLLPAEVALAYAEAQELEFVEKKAYSFMIKVADSNCIDLGLFWLLMGIAGICGSVWMYLQTMKPGPESEKYQPEELDIPGL